MALTYDKDGLLLPAQPCKDPAQKGWAEYLDNLAQDVREGKIKIVTNAHNFETHTITLTYEGETTRA